MDTPEEIEAELVELRKDPLWCALEKAKAFEVQKHADLKEAQKAANQASQATDRARDKWSANYSQRNDRKSKGESLCPTPSKRATC